jgi:transporter family protein
MTLSYVAWALIGMVGYSLTTLFMKLAIRDGKFSSFLVLALATTMVCSTSWIIATLRGDVRSLTSPGFPVASALWTFATGAALTIAVSGLFRGLSLGPASVVVPLYGMFIVGGAILGMLFLHEPVTLRKVIGIALAAFSVYLIAGNSPR